MSKSEAFANFKAFPHAKNIFIPFYHRTLVES